VEKSAYPYNINDSKKKKETTWYDFFIFIFGIIAIFGIFLFIRDFYVNHHFNGDFLSSAVLAGLMYIFLKENDFGVNDA